MTCLHNTMVRTNEAAHAWKCAECGYVYGLRPDDVRSEEEAIALGFPSAKAAREHAEWLAKNGLEVSLVVGSTWTQWLSFHW